MVTLIQYLVSWYCTPAVQWSKYKIGNSGQTAQVQLKSGAVVKVQWWNKPTTAGRGAGAGAGTGAGTGTGTGTGTGAGTGAGAGTGTGAATGAARGSGVLLPFLFLFRE